MTRMDEKFVRAAISLAKEARQKEAHPFGAVLVKDDEIVAQSWDRSVELSDPTAHAELNVIRDYCRDKKVFSLEGYVLYSSTEPCAMCAGAIHWARISRVVYSVSQEMLQRLTGEKRKLSCDDIVNSGRKQAEIVGPVLSEEGLSVFDGYAFLPKVERHSRMQGGP